MMINLYSLFFYGKNYPNIILFKIVCKNTFISQFSGE